MVKRSLTIVLLLANSQIALSDSQYKGYLKVYCAGCSSSADQVAAFARDQVGLGGDWAVTSEFFVDDLNTGVKHFVSVSIGFADGQNFLGLDAFGALLRTLLGSNVPKIMRVRVYDANGKYIETVQWDMSVVFGSVVHEVWELDASDTLTDYASNYVTAHVVYSSTSSYLGATRTPVTGVDECYGECQIYY